MASIEFLESIASAKEKADLLRAAASRPVTSTLEAGAYGAYREPGLVEGSIAELVNRLENALVKRRDPEPEGEPELAEESGDIAEPEAPPPVTKRIDPAPARPSAPRETVEVVSAVDARLQAALEDLRKIAARPA